MENAFKEYHQPTEEEFKDLREICWFVFDTNTLLDLYRYEEATAKKYLTLMEELREKNQLRMPHQVGYEFHENRLNIISGNETAYHDAHQLLDGIKNTIDGEYKKLRQKHKEHPYLNSILPTESIKEIDKSIGDLQKQILDAENKHPKLLQDDWILKQLNAIFSGCVGKEYSKEKICEIEKEGENRYKEQVPPGYKDGGKSNGNSYGDLIIRYQMIEQSFDTKRPIIFISNDIKPDWRLEKNGKKIMPLPQLKKEMQKKAGTNFHIYTMARFGELNRIDNKTIDEVKKVAKKMRKRHDEEKWDENDILRARHHRLHGHIQPLEYENWYRQMRGLIISFEELGIQPSNAKEIDDLEELGETVSRIKGTRDRYSHNPLRFSSSSLLYVYTQKLLSVIYKILNRENINPDQQIRLRKKTEQTENSIGTLFGDL